MAIAGNQAVFDAIKAIQNDKMFNGPTSVSIFSPWKKYLEERGVCFRFGISVNQLNITDNRISECILSDKSKVEFDQYVIAVNYHALEKIFKDSQLLAVSGINAELLSQSFEWSNGTQFYLKKLPVDNEQFRPGVLTAYLSSPWSLISVVQGEGFWSNFGNVPPKLHTLSVTFTNAYNPGILYNKPLFQCNREEIKQELLAQMGIIDTSIVKDWQLDEAVQYLNQDMLLNVDPVCFYHQDTTWMTNNSPLLTPRPGYYQAAPKSKTIWNNLHLGGSYCDTAYKIPTMEKASESGFHAAHSVLKDIDQNKNIEIPYTYNSHRYSLFRQMDAKIYTWYLNILKKLSREDS